MPAHFHPKDRVTSSEKSARRNLRNRKRRIETPLRGRDGSGESRPMSGAPNGHPEVAERPRGFAAGGIGSIHERSRRVELVEEIDEAICLRDPRL